MKYLATLLFCLSVIVLQAQKISGKVMNKETGEPLVAVNILEKGTTNGTTTNAEGQFELNLIQQEAILIFSYIGFGTSNPTKSWTKHDKRGLRRGTYSR